MRKSLIKEKRQTASEYLKAAGMLVRWPGGLAKPATEVITDPEGVLAGLCYGHFKRCRNLISHRRVDINDPIYSTDR